MGVLILTRKSHKIESHRWEFWCRMWCTRRPTRTEHYGFHHPQRCLAHLQWARDLHLAKQLAQESLRPPAGTPRPLLPGGRFRPPGRGQEHGPVYPVLAPGLQHLRAPGAPRRPPGHLAWRGTLRRHARLGPVSRYPHESLAAPLADRLAPRGRIQLVLYLQPAPPRRVHGRPAGPADHPDRRPARWQASVARHDRPRYRLYAALLSAPRRGPARPGRRGRAPLPAPRARPAPAAARPAHLPSRQRGAPRPARSAGGLRRAPAGP